MEEMKNDYLSLFLKIKDQVQEDFNKGNQEKTLSLVKDVETSLHNLRDYLIKEGSLSDACKVKLELKSIVDSFTQDLDTIMQVRGADITRKLER